jgi:HEPN domain-containing protein
MSGILTSRDFQRAAEQRFKAAKYLFEGDFALDAFYFAGYSVECILKALIMRLTPEANHEEAFHRLKSGAKMHDPEHLKEELKNLNYPIPNELVKGFRRFKWSTNLRYDSGRRPHSEVRGYMKVAEKTIAWAKENLS